jgi:hypothetical protein
VLIRRWYTHVTEITGCTQLVIYLGLESISHEHLIPQIFNYIAGVSENALIVQMELIQSNRNESLTKDDLKIITSAFLTKSDAVYKLHATLVHLPFSKIERMILKGIMKG